MNQNTTKNIVLFASFGVILGFFLPWLTFSGFNISAFSLVTVPKIAENAPVIQVLWLLPLASIFILINNIRNTKFMKNDAFIKCIPLLVFVGLIAYMFIALKGARSNHFDAFNMSILGGAASGFYITILSSITLFIFAFVSGSPAVVNPPVNAYEPQATENTEISTGMESTDEMAVD